MVHLLTSCALGAALTLLPPGESPGEKVAWLSENAVAIRSIDPEDEDFSDLAPLGQAIGDARVVQLGEQSHGDGSCFLAKGRLIRFLHQEMGFDVLVWESGFFTCSVMEEALKTGVPLQEAADEGVFPIWGHSAQCRSVFEYARSTHDSERPLEMAGLDCQLSGKGARKLGQAVLDFVGDAEGLAIEESTTEDFRALFDAMMTANSPIDEEVLDRGMEATRALSEAVASLGESREAAFINQTLMDFALQMRLRDLFRDRATMQEGSNLRDVAMGKTISWLANHYYRGRKLIVWAASRHIAHDLDRIDTQSDGFTYDRYQTLGDVVHETLGDDAYTILFDAYQGQAGIVGRDPFDIEPAPEGSLTAICHQTGKPYLFIDLRVLREKADHWLNQPLEARPFGHGLMVARWGEVADAIFFTDWMEPSTPAEP